MFHLRLQNTLRNSYQRETKTCPSAASCQVDKVSVLGRNHLVEAVPRVQAAPRSSPRCVQEALTFAGAVLGVVSRRAVRHAAIPQEQVPGVLALQAHAAAVPQVGHTLLAQGVAI